LYGDQSGSPRRDSRQNPDAPWADGQTGLPPHSGPEGYPPSFGGGLTEDVRVAGGPGPETSVDYPEFPMGPAAMPPMQETATSSTAAFAPLPLPAPGELGPPGGPMGPGASGPGRRKPRGPQKAIKIAAVVAAFAVVTGGGIGAWAMTSGGGSKPVAAKKNVQPKTMAAAMPPMTPAQIKAQESARRKTMADEASRAAQRQSIDTSFVSKGTKPAPSKSSSTGTNSNTGPNMGNPTPSGTSQAIAKAMLSSFGWSPSTQFGCLVSLWDRESGWNTHAANPSGAYGIPQSLPGSKMASAGPDWQNNATTQIKWGLGYIRDRYGSPCGAWGHSQSTGWY